MQISNGVKRRLSLFFRPRRIILWLIITFCLVAFFSFFCSDRAYAATSRIKGTNESISTYGAAGHGRDYTSLQTWENATDNDNVTGQVSPVLECYDDAASFNDSVLLAGATNNATYFRIIRPAAGQGHDGTPNNGVTFNNTVADTVVFSNTTDNYTSIQDLIIFNSNSTANSRNTVNLNAPYSSGIGLIVKGTNSGSGAAMGINIDATGVTVINCLVYGTKGAGFVTGTAAGESYYLYNNTAYGNNTYGFRVTGATASTWTATNCLATNNGTADFSSVATVTKVVTYSASGDATADDWGGAGNRINQSANFAFVNTGTNDYHLTSTDAGARNYGTSLSGTFDDDINKGTMGAGKAGQTRSGTWDIGFDEAGVDISGTVYTDEGSTHIGANRTAVLKVNGAAACGIDCTAETDANGAYTITSVSIAAASGVVTVYLDGETEKAVTVTRAADTTSDITGLNLYQNRLIVRQEDGNATTNANLGQWDKDDDSDIHFTSNSGSLIVDNDTELHIWNGKTFSPGGTVTTSPGGASGDIHINYINSSTTFTAGGAVSVGGSWTADSGSTFTPNSNSVTFTAAGSGKTITPGSSSFYDLEFAASLAWTTSYDTPEWYIYSLAIDSTNGVLYAGTSSGGIIYRCATSTGCDAAEDWTTSYDTSETTIYSLAVDSTNGVLYAGTSSGGIIYRCATSTGCDAAEDWTTSYDTSETTIYSLAVDSTNGVLYAGTSSGGIIYRCATSTGCDAAGDWTTSYDTPEWNIYSLAVDSTNGVLYAGTSSGGIIYRCATSTGCDAAGDWTTSYDTPESSIQSLALDSTNGVLYAGAGWDGIIYRCATSTGCDAAGDWTTSYDTPESYIYSLAIDSTNGVLYAGTYSNGIIYRCATSTGCDAAGDWTTSYDTPEWYIYSLAVDSTNGVLYAGSGLNGIIYRGATGLGAWTFQGNATTTNNFTITSGTVIGPSAGQITVGGNWSNSATFTHNSSTVLFNKSSSTQTLNSGGTGAGKIFSGLTHSGAGTLQLTTNAINIDGAFSQTAGIFDCNSQNQSFAGSFSLSSGTTYTKGGTLTFDGTTTYTDSTATPQNIGAVTISGTSVTLASSMTADTMNISSGTLNLASSGYTLKLANAGATATVLTVSGTLTPGTSSTVQYSATNSGGNINVATTTYNNLQVSGNETYVLTGNLTGGNVLTGGVTIDSGATLDTVSGSNYNITLAGNWANSGTFTPNSGTVDFNKSSTTQTLNSGGTGAGKIFSGLTHSGAGTLQLTTNAINVDGAFSQTAGIFDCNSQNQSFAGNFSLSSGTTYTKGGTLTFDGTTTYTDSTATPQNIGAVTISGTSVTLASSMTVDTMNISSGTLNLASSGYTLKLANAGATATVLTVSGTLTPGTNSTVQYAATNSGGNVNVATTTYNNLQFTPGSAETYVLTGNLTTPNNLTGNLTIDSNATLDTTGSNYNVTLAGNWANSGVFTSGTGTVTLNGVNQSLTGNTTFNNLTKQENTNNSTDSILTIAQSSTQTVGGTLDFDGLDDNDRLNLVSSNPGTRYTFDFTNSDQSATWLDVTDANASSHNIDCSSNCVNGGNNDDTEGPPHWIFTSISLGLSCSASGALKNYTIGDSNNYNEDTFGSTLCTLTTSGAPSWTFTVDSSNLTGTHNTVTNSNILLRTDGNVTSGATITDSSTGVTEPAGPSYSLDSTRTILSGDASASGTYNNRPTLRIQNLNSLFQESDSGTLTFTLQ